MEISRWSSEPGERTPPDHRNHRHAPRKVRRESSGRFRHPIRGAFVLRRDPVVFARASLDHQLISMTPPALESVAAIPIRHGAASSARRGGGGGVAKQKCA